MAQRGLHLVGEDCMEVIEPALESLYESTAYPALTGNEVNRYLRLIWGGTADFSVPFGDGRIGGIFLR